MKKSNMEAIEKIINSINAKESYVLEAGAGAGKTYALIQTIDHLLSEKSGELEKKIKILYVSHILTLQKMKSLNDYRIIP
ncbi:DEAD/DEAH box helicase family protein [Tenacibaculum aquimarinum]|uniref:DEAD/DEAH box helicase family protein n=1 Tax=Tenacibaculum aquimarinum TaxID=2910675 RepID=UPI001F0B298B|nr:DEAD/DEAH box helicase family protein [Tenacibaculum aquimarinum]MCH3884550.1 DEAD/DEAH box helicase family protein [Tenacibaculum aquimarinum]